MSTLAAPLPGFHRAMATADGPCSHCAGLGVIEATDFFCGAGGSSVGLEFVCCEHCGRSLIVVTQAINHWDLAVQAHNANFPNADHDVHDMEEIPVTRLRRTPLAWFSPECTHHAYCRGQKADDEAAMRSRATFNDIVRFTAHHKYDAVIVENVVEARLWCDAPGHGEKCSCGSNFDNWRAAMHDEGYESQIVYFNSQFALPTPQSRDRMYVVFWRKGLPRPNLDFRPMSWCSDCETVVRGVQTWKPTSKKTLRAQPGLFEWGRYGAQYVYTCPGCTSAVAPAVAGARTIIDWGLDSVRIGDRAKPLAAKTRERIKTGLQRLATTDPVQVQVGGNLYERQGYARVWSVNDPLRTVTGTPYMGLVTPAGGQEAKARTIDKPCHTILGNDRLGVVVRVGGQSQSVKGRTLDEPLNTIVGSDRQVGLVVPGKSDTVPTALDEPASTVTTRVHMGVVVQNMENNTGRDVDEPMGPVTTGGNHMLVQVNRGSKKGGKDSRPPRDLDEPTPTVSGHGELALVALRNHGDVRSAEQPAHTLTGGGTHHGLLVYNGNPGFVRDLNDAAGTVTGRDKQSLLVPYYGTGVARDTRRPMGAITGHDREALIITDEDVDACLFRMLQWPELLRAQMMHALPDGSDYVLTARRKDARGRMRELSNELRVKMIGNAVSSPVATMLGRSVVEALA